MVKFGTTYNRRSIIMNKNSTSIIILAAGKGSRMKSPIAKVLHNISGKPMLYHIIKASSKISDDITVVIAHQKEAVKEQMEAFFDDIKFVVQDSENFEKCSTKKW